MNSMIEDAPPSTSQVSTRYRVALLGPFTLERDGTPLDTSHWQLRVLTLFKLLATANDRRRLQDEIIDLLWSEAPPDAGAGNLRQLIHRLRLALGEGEPSPLLSDRGWIALNPSYEWEIDLDRFEELIETAAGDITALLEAAALYRGEPLAEDRYDDWAVPVRTRIQRDWRQLCSIRSTRRRSVVCSWC
jgi:DNA-binding SARP family transcriptional activator